jgi:hypothetical protein
MPSRTVPASPPATRRIAAWAAAASSRMTLARVSSSAPALVRATWRVVRVNSGVPSSDQFAERRRGDVQPLGGPPEVQFGGHCHERFELTQLHVLTVPRQVGGRPDEVCLAARLFGLAE